MNYIHLESITIIAKSSCGGVTPEHGRPKARSKLRPTLRAGTPTGGWEFVSTVGCRKRQDPQARRLW
ncbi:MAG: hypothetical protein HYU64_11565 [Armatimonadetes bacterium]|nr:hypothetical protein [Armatimonadota bacterium]